MLKKGMFSVHDRGLVTKLRYRRRRMDRPYMNDTKINIHNKLW